MVDRFKGRIASNKVVKLARWYAGRKGGQQYNGLADRQVTKYYKSVSLQVQLSYNL